MAAIATFPGTSFGQGTTGAIGAAQSNPTCVRLESQLAALERGDARSELIRRHEEAIARQQAELDRAAAQSQRLGCQGGGFFFFGGNQNPQCDGLNAQVQRGRSNLDRLHGELQRMQGGGHEAQRRALIAGLSQHDCGPQYRAAAQRSGGFLETLFGGAFGAPSGLHGGGGGDALPQSSTFRTVCVRTCDGFFFPISFSTVPSKFRDDERACQRMCPATEAVLFSHRNPGEDISRATSISGKLYTELPNAFRYRETFDASCSCKRPGESWAEALKGADERTERGDIIVTDENAKAIAQAKQDAETRAGKSEKGKGREPKGANAKPDDAGGEDVRLTPAKIADTNPDSAKRPPRQVGPQFIAR